MRKLHTTTVWIRKAFTVKKVLFSFNLKRIIPRLQWLAGKLDFLAVYDVEWGYFELRLRTLEVLLCCFLS